MSAAFREPNGLAGRTQVIAFVAEEARHAATLEARSRIPGRCLEVASMAGSGGFGGGAVSAPVKPAWLMVS